MSVIESMAQQELSTTLEELPQVLKRLRDRKISGKSRVRLIWDDEAEQPTKVAKNDDIQSLLDDLKKLKKPSPDGQKAFEEGRQMFRETFNL